MTDDLFTYAAEQAKKTTMPATRADQIFAAFKTFHLANPAVWTLFQRFTFDAINAGRENYSAYAIFERIRWHTEIDTRDQDGLKLNNNFRPYYSRMFHVAYPQHNGFFPTRKQTSVAKRAPGIDRQFFDSGPVGDEKALNCKLQALLTPSTE